MTVGIGILHDARIVAFRLFLDHKVGAYGYKHDGDEFDRETARFAEQDDGKKGGYCRTRFVHRHDLIDIAQ